MKHLSQVSKSARLSERRKQSWGLWTSVRGAGLAGRRHVDAKGDAMYTLQGSGEQRT